MFHGNLYRAIKQKLWSGRKEVPGRPEFRIELPVEQDVFDTELGQATGSYIERGNFND